MSDLAVAWADLKARVWATLEPPLARMVALLNRLVSR